MEGRYVKYGQSKHQMASAWVGQEDTPQYGEAA